jgi:hypothetical protein
MAIKQHSICLAGMIVFASCVAVSASPNDIALRAKYQRSRIGAAMQREADDWPELARNASPISLELHRAVATRFRAVIPLAFSDTAISSAGVAPPLPAWGQFQNSPLLFPHTVLPPGVPCGRAPPSL